MKRMVRRWGLCCPLVLAFATVLPGPALSAEDEVNEEQFQMIAGLLKEADKDMRAVGYQFIREEMPGEAVTKKFAALLGELPADGKIGLVEALADRGDAAARPAIVELAGSDNAAVRPPAIRALGSLGNAADVPLLAEKTASGSDAEKSAARQALTRLKGDDINAAVLSAMERGEPGLRAELLGVLAARNAKTALPQVLEAAGDTAPAVRLAAIRALRYLADEANTAAIVGVLESAADENERREAELALLTVCSRGREACADAVIAGLEGADAAARVPLLDALARAGGPKALSAIVGALEDENPGVKNEAMRLLSRWPDAAAAPELLKIASTSDDLRHRVLAVRGLVRLASPAGEKPADLKMLGDVLGLARRPEEKRLVVGVLGNVEDPKALELVVSALDDAAVADEAGLAALRIVQNTKDKADDKAPLRKALEQVAQKADNEQIRGRAQEILQSL